MGKHSFLGIILLLMALPQSLQAQTTEWRDTLRPALKIDNRGVRVETGAIKADINTVRQVVSPLGEGDAIKLIQTLPGVSTGAEGSSAIFVRGGNMGNNLMTLDGVPVYGISHLLGLTSAIPSDVVRDMDFQVGGFEGDRSNLLASHIRLRSVTPAVSQAKVHAFASNFLLGAGADIPLGDKAGLVMAGRLSPLQLEYKALKGLLSKNINTLKDFGAGIYDFYGKFYWNIAPERQLTAWAFGSWDHYRFDTGDGTSQGLGWTNLIGAVQYHARTGAWTQDASLSFNYYENGQELSSGKDKSSLKMKSQLKELTLEGKWMYPASRHLTASFGAQGKVAIFNPGASSIDNVYVNQRSVPWTGTIWGQMDWKEEGRYKIMGSLRGNLFHSDGQFFFRPEVSLLAEANLSEWLVASFTADRLVQFYHTLEGVPLGWSMDLLIPADASTPPETAWQAFAGLRGNLGAHHFSAGGYYKQMRNLVYYTEAAAIFSAARLGWKDNIDVGRGVSFGMELLYEFTSEKFYAKAAYTLSKTTRVFPTQNDGFPFPAKFDRPHILNMNAEWTLARKEHVRHAVNAAFTLQSGHCESVKSFSYPSLMPYDDEPEDLPYYGNKPNNYRMPTYIRLDIGYNFTWAKGRWEHNLLLGIYNVLNRHNPFMLTYDQEQKTWMEVSLFPILPNFSYRLAF